MLIETWKPLRVYSLNQLCTLVVLWRCLLSEVPYFKCAMFWGVAFFTALSEVFPCFLLSCKANARVKPAKAGHGPHSSSFLCCCMYCLFCVVLCIVCMYMCTVLLPPGGYPIAVKYIISYHISYAVKWILLCLIHEFCWGQILIRSRSSGSCRTDFYVRPKNIYFLTGNSQHSKWFESLRCQI